MICHPVILIKLKFDDDGNYIVCMKQGCLSDYIGLHIATWSFSATISSFAFSHLHAIPAGGKRYSKFVTISVLPCPSRTAN